MASRPGSQLPARIDHLETRVDDLTTRVDHLEEATGAAAPAAPEPAPEPEAPRCPGCNLPVDDPSVTALRVVRLRLRRGPPEASAQVGSRVD